MSENIWLWFYTSWLFQELLFFGNYGNIKLVRIDARFQPVQQARELIVSVSHYMINNSIEITDPATSPDTTKTDNSNPDENNRINNYFDEPDETINLLLEWKISSQTLHINSNTGDTFSTKNVYTTSVALEHGTPTSQAPLVDPGTSSRTHQHQQQQPTVHSVQHNNLISSSVPTSVSPHIQRSLDICFLSYVFTSSLANAQSPRHTTSL